MGGGGRTEVKLQQRRDLATADHHVSLQGRRERAEVWRSRVTFKHEYAWCMEGKSR